MSGKKRKRLAPSATPWDGVPEDRLSPSERVVMASHRSIYDFRHAAFDGDADFFNAYERERCPRCGGGEIMRFGFQPDGVRRWRCKSCGTTFTPATGTIFEDRKLPLPSWVDFLLQTFTFESIASMTREDRRSVTTPPYWMAKLFAVLEGVQDGIVLSGRAQIDETYYPVPVAEQAAVDGKKLRGLSRNKICIGVGWDVMGKSVYIEEGLGKTSGKKTWDAFGTRIAPGTKLWHDMENGHNRLVRELGLVETRFNAKEISKLPDSQNPLREVNHLCFLVKLFLDSHSGFKRESMQGYLNVFSVIMNPPEEKMEKAAMVLDLAMRNPKTLRYRKFYERKARSNGEG